MLGSTLFPGGGALSSGASPRRILRDAPQIPSDANLGQVAFYNNPTYAYSWSAVMAAIAQRTEPVMIIGDSGMGKSHLIRRVIRSLPEEVCWVSICEPQIDDEGCVPFDSDCVLKLIADAIPLEDSKSPSDQGACAGIDRLRSRLTRLRESEHYLAVFVDDANGTSEDVVSDLLRLAQPDSDETWLLTIILAGSPQLEARVRRPPLSDLCGDGPLSCTLRPLRPTEIAPYIEKCFSPVHGPSEKLLSPEAIACIGAYSQGAPRLISTLFDAALLTAKRRGQSKITREIVEEATSLCSLSAGAGKKQHRQPSVLQREEVPVIGAFDQPRETLDTRGHQTLKLVPASGTSTDNTVRTLVQPLNQGDQPVDRTESLNRVLKSLQNGSPDVEASALITEDGLMIASALPQDLDEIRVAGMSSTLLSLGTRAAAELRRGEVTEVIVRGEQGYAVMIGAGRGVSLLVVANERAKLGLIFFDMSEAINSIKRIL